jgi:hypothetical protein
MGVERRRAGFRLPWGPDGEQSEEATATVTDGAEEPTRISGDVPSETNGTDAAHADSSTQPAAPEPMAAEGGDADDFLKSLVGAMRSVAETSRDTSIAELRTAIDARIEALGAEAAQAETDIRRQADMDLEAVGDWERSEIDRVRTEANGRRDARRTKLEEDLAEHRAASERAADATRSRLAQHENDLAAFFAQLGEITDPAAFVAAAKRMPRAPELESGTTTALTLAATANTAPPAMSDDDRRTAVVAAPDQSDADAAQPDAPADATGAVDSNPAAATADNGVSPAGDAQLAERLAQLDERLNEAPQPAVAPATPAPATAGGEASTAIIVKGLGSFGAITSFKQSLERVEGVRGVTLSLGPTGEFVYRASHAGDFDIKAAITSIEGPTASIEDSDGMLVVTLSRGR